MDAVRTDHEPFRCDVDSDGKAVHVRPVGELDLATVPLLETQLAELHASGFEQLTLDLRGVSFLDSSALRLIIVWDDKSRTDSFAFSLIEGPPAVQRLFDLTCTTDRLPFVKD